MAMATPPGTAFDAQAQYLREIAAIPSLTDQEERHLVAMLQSPDIELIKHARTRLVECFQPLVLSIAKRYAPRCQHLQLLDLVQEGNLGLIQALDSHDGRETPAGLRSWLFLWIRGAIAHAWLRHEGTLQLPATQARALRRLLQAQHQFLMEHGRHPTATETAKALGYEVQTVLRLQILQRLQEPVLLPTGAEDASSFESWFVDPSSVDHGKTGTVLHARVRDLVARLPERERAVIRLRYGFADGTSRSLRDIAHLLGLSHPVVERLERRARIRLRHELEQAGYSAA
jgi:RNA polymerase primary sigma factor